MLSTDRAVFDHSSATRERMISYGELVDELHIIVFSKGELEHEKGKISERVYLYPTNSKNRFKYIKDAVRIGKAIGKERSINLVTAQDPFEVGLAGYKIAKKLNIALELQIHTDPFSPFFKKLNLLNRIRVLIAKRILPKANCIRVVSPLIKKSVLKVLPKIGKQGTCFNVLPIFVPPFPDVQSTEPFSLPGITHQILFVGRFEKEKNLALALEAFALVADKHKDSAFVLVGDGSERNKLERKAASLGIASQVFFVGFQKDPTPYYRAASVVLLTSDFEGAGRIFIEAGMEGRAIVSTNVGFAPLLLEEEDKQFLCPVGDEKAIAKALTTLLEHDQLRHESGMRVQSRVSRIVSLSKEEYLRALSLGWQKCVIAKPR